MLNGYAYLFVHVIDQIDDICSIARADPTGTWKKNKATGSLGGMVFGTFLDTVRYLAKETGMRSVADQVSRIQKWTEMLDLPLAQIAPECIQLRVRIEEELQRKDFLFIAEDMTELYNKCDPRRGAVKGTDPFELGGKFKKAHADIASAGRCLAVGEGTACVMHLSRALEAVVQQLSGRLGMTVTHTQTWRKLTGNMDDKIKKMPDATKAQKAKKTNWEDARINLHHLGSVWRNSVMHPAESYTVSQAREIFEACRVFMTALARL